jgi:hypothetical protein
VDGHALGVAQRRSTRPRASFFGGATRAGPGASSMGKV